MSSGKTRGRFLITEKRSPRTKGEKPWGPTPTEGGGAFRIPPIQIAGQLTQLSRGGYQRGRGTRKGTDYGWTNFIQGTTAEGDARKPRKGYIAVPTTSPSRKGPIGSLLRPFVQRLARKGPLLKLAIVLWGGGGGSWPKKKGGGGGKKTRQGGKSQPQRTLRVSP